jgi:hypothetical protein
MLIIGMQILYIKALSACVRLSVRDATVPRFNPPAEPARTVGFGNQAASAREIPEEPGSERTRDPGRTRQRARERETSVRLSVTTGRREK